MQSQPLNSTHTEQSNTQSEAASYLSIQVENIENVTTSITEEDWRQLQRLYSSVDINKPLPSIPIPHQKPQYPPTTNVDDSNHRLPTEAATENQHTRLPQSPVQSDQLLLSPTPPITDHRSSTHDAHINAIPVQYQKKIDDPTCEEKTPAARNATSLSGATNNPIPHSLSNPHSVPITHQVSRAHRTQGIAKRVLRNTSNILRRTQLQIANNVDHTTPLTNGTGTFVYTRTEYANSEPVVEQRIEINAPLDAYGMTEMILRRS